MGSHIVSFFSRSINRHPEMVQKRLNEVFDQLQGELFDIQNMGRFSKNSGVWSIDLIEAEQGEPEHICGEGPFGFSISVYERTVVFTSIERFGAIQKSAQGIASPLRIVLNHVANALGSGHDLAVASGGFGDTDGAVDLAYYESAEFADVCECLKTVIGPPASKLDGFGSGIGALVFERTWTSIAGIQQGVTRIDV